MTSRPAAERLAAVQAKARLLRVRRPPTGRAPSLSSSHAEQAPCRASLRHMGKKFPLPPWLEHSAMVKKKMKDRGFKMADRVQLCEKCDEFAEETWSLKGPEMMGG